MKIYAATENEFFDATEQIQAFLNEIKILREERDEQSRMRYLLNQAAKKAIKIINDNYSYCTDSYCEGYCQGCEIQRAHNEVIEVLESAILECKQE